MLHPVGGVAVHPSVLSDWRGPGPLEMSGEQDGVAPGLVFWMSRGLL